ADRGRVHSFDDDRFAGWQPKLRVQRRRRDESLAMRTCDALRRQAEWFGARIEAESAAGARVEMERDWDQTGCVMNDAACRDAMVRARIDASTASLAVLGRENRPGSFRDRCHGVAPAGDRCKPFATRDWCCFPSRMRGGGENPAASAAHAVRRAASRSAQSTLD